MEAKEKRIYLFGELGKSAKDILGGKGANLSEMKKIGLPVPEGFTITTRMCIEYHKNSKKLPEGLWEDVLASLKKLESMTGKKFGGEKNPLLLSVRSGAPVSMPGMMDTILNIGLNDKTVKALAKMTGNERFAFDCYRRLIQMFGNVVFGIEHGEFENVLERYKKGRADTELSPEELKSIVEDYKGVIAKFGKTFPQDVYEQLKLAITAVFDSWNNKRAITYRKANNIPEDMGTAVNVQEMVFGNAGWDSATGVGFTRNPATGEKEFYGEYLLNAQGEDVVAGIRTPKPIEELKKDIPHVYERLKEVYDKLERHYKDMQDVEFTVERGKLYLLQTRTGKRTTKAAVKIAVDMVKEGLISKQEAVMRINPNEIKNLLHPQIDENQELDIIAKGLGASPGAAAGMVVLDTERAVKLAEEEDMDVILVRKETSPEDIHGMISSKGILTARGGQTSHAAVVARGMGKPCVVGCESISIYPEERLFKVNGRVVKEGDWITIDGSTGNVIFGKARLVEPKIAGEFEELLEWADEMRKLGVLANADTPEDAKTARNFGAEGIGLCRTEHMFFEKERVPIVQKMILAKTPKERKEYLDVLLEMQKKDFKGIFKAMDGLPVTIRLLDPPLHEFLPSHEELLVEVTRLKERGKRSAEKEALLKRVTELKEFNPMLGHRGCRLGITHADIYEMQLRAIFLAASEGIKEGVRVKPEIMVPLVCDAKELEIMRRLVEKIALEVEKQTKVKVNYKVGTMIELPRAALTAGKIARFADFFSFGTNDLTQTTYGFSRDDAEGKFLKKYKEMGIIEEDPFVTLDVEGVGKLMELCIREGRKVKKDLKIGICGEQGGEPKTVDFCHKIGLNYVSCSPFRVIVARLAAAQAAIRNG